MATPNMNLSLPTVAVTEGTQWATDLNTAITSIDSHDHSSGKGVKITPAGMTINTDLDIDDNIFYDFKATKYSEQLASLSGASNSNSIHSVLGDLYWTNGSGTAIQLTSGGSIISSPGSASIFEPVAVSTSLSISAAATYVYLLVDTTATRTITLPLASAVSDGRIYIIKDISGQSNTNNITLAISGSDTVDGASSQTLNSDYGSWTIVGDGSTSWYIS